MESKAKASLHRLFHPGAIAVVGASPKGGWGATALQNCLDLGFSGNLYAVHPRADEVAGVPAYSSLSDLPEVPDAIAVAVPAKNVPAVLIEADRLGVGAAVVYASGFGELDGQQAEQEELFSQLSDDFRVIGPNCYGVSSYGSGMGLWGASVPLQHRGVEGTVALVAQSGNMSMTVAMSSRLPAIAYAASLGNQVDVDATDCIEYFLEDSKVRVISLIIEGINDVPRFRRVAERAAQQNVVIVALKIGSSKKGEAATVAHTGTLSGDDAMYDALFAQTGIVRVADIEELIAVSTLAANANTVEGNRLGIFASSGGECGLSADLAENIGLELRDFEDHSKRALHEILPEYGYVTNPFDLTAGGWGNQDIYRHVTETLLQDSGTDIVAFIGDAPNGSDLASMRWPGMVQGAGEAARASDKPVMLISTSTDVNPDLGRLCASNGITYIAGHSSAFVAIRKLAIRSEAVKRLKVESADRPESASHIDWRVTGSGILSETTAKSILDEYGIQTPLGQDVTTPDAAAAFAAECGYPVVAKLVADDLAHKTEIGGVVVGIEDEATLREAVRQVLDAGERALGAEAVRGARIEKMASLPNSIELIVGGRNVPAGSTVVIGAGGILTELLGDSATLLWPFTAAEVDQKLNSLRISLLIDGYRGSAPVDRKAIVDAALSMGRLLSENPEISEVDVNPLLVGSSEAGVVALDALISAH